MNVVYNTRYGQCLSTKCSDQCNQNNAKLGLLYFMLRVFNFLKFSIGLSYKHLLLHIHSFYFAHSISTASIIPIFPFKFQFSSQYIQYTYFLFLLIHSVFQTFSCFCLLKFSIHSFKHLYFCSCHLHSLKVLHGKA